jgi:hypothetical protein
VLLPAVRELEKLVSRVVVNAHRRLWEALAELVTARQAQLLLNLVEVPEGRRWSPLEDLRRGPRNQTGTALAATLRNVAAVAGIGLGGVSLDVVPQRRIVDLARVGMRANATDLRRIMPYPKRLATLLATVRYLEAKTTDDALELFDVIMTSELLAKAERRSNADKVKRFPRVSKDASKLAAAITVLLDAEEWGDKGLTVDRLWAAIENVVSRAELRASVANINAVVPPGSDPDGEWRAILMTRYPLVRRFLRLLVETVEFGASADAAPVLYALQALPDLLDVGATKAAPAGFMINDQAMGTGGLVLSGTPKDSLHTVDLMYRRDGGSRPEVFISDTGSYSDIVFGLLKLIGVAYRPELADLPDQKLWRIHPTADYGLLDTAARGKIDTARIKRHWPDILRLVGSVHNGDIAPSDAIRMLQHGGNPTQLGIAVAHFGRIFKTLHVLAYVDREPYRRDIKRMRNLQEQRHGWPSTCSTAARASCTSPITRGWKTSSARSGW